MSPRLPAAAIAIVSAAAAAVRDTPSSRGLERKGEKIYPNQYSDFLSPRHRHDAAAVAVAVVAVAVAVVAVAIVAVAGAVVAVVARLSATVIFRM